MVKQETAGQSKVEEDIDHGRRGYRSWKEGTATWEEYKTVVRGCRRAAKRTKASLELNLPREDKDNNRTCSNTLQ